MGYERTGCMFCMFGLHCEKEGETRLDQMAKTHPKQHKYCMEKLGLDEVLKWYPKKQEEEVKVTTTPTAPPTTPLKLYPSSAAWAWGELIVTENRQGCGRNLLWENVARIVEPFPPELAAMGLAGEEKYLKHLTENQDYPFHRELPFKSEINGVVVSGRLDFLVYHDKGRIVHERKSSKSSKVLYDVIRDGKPKLNHVSQVISYFIHLGLTKGVLSYWYQPKDKERNFRIEVTDDGKILIDKELYTHTVADQLAHQVLSAEVLKTQRILERPAGNTPCRFCVYRDRCDKYDEFGGTDAEFIEMLKEEI
jgi:hypothetical protein